MSETNPDKKKFESGAVTDWKACIEELFGKDATKKVAIQYCRKTTDNEFPCYVGKTESLLKYLKETKAAMKEVGIKEVTADGFVAEGKDGKNNNVSKTFTMEAITKYDVYKKKGWETMGCCKTYDQFVKECEFVGDSEFIDIKP